jgi:hypothetical protein
MLLVLISQIIPVDLKVTGVSFHSFSLTWAQNKIIIQFLVLQVKLFTLIFANPLFQQNALRWVHLFLKLIHMWRVKVEKMILFVFPVCLIVLIRRDLILNINQLKMPIKQLLTYLWQLHQLIIWASVILISLLIVGNLMINL